MSHQDKNVTKSSHLRHVMQWLLRDISWDKKLHASCSWTFRWLVTTSLLWAWSAEDTQGERFVCAQRITLHLQPQKKKQTSVQAFMEILRRHTPYLRRQLLQACRNRMTECPHWQTGGFIVFGVDGTDVAVPRTHSNQAAFTTDGKSEHQKRTKKKTKQVEKQRRCPRILMTTLYHLASGLSWDWRLGSKSNNERSQLKAMLQSLPDKSLIVGDAGFVGYDFLSSVLEHCDLVIRVGSNVTLLKRLGRVRQAGDIVSIWPKGASQRRLAPLMFRLVVVRNGKHPVYLITSVLDSKLLSDGEIALLYHDRWGIELYHRHLKQTLGCRKMLSRSSENALVELQWTVLGFLAMNLYAVAQFSKLGVSVARMSIASVIRAFRHTARDYLHPVDTDSLHAKIRNARKDEYQRNSAKESRDYPRKRKHRAPGKPKILTATAEQKNLAKQIENQSLAA